MLGSDEWVPNNAKLPVLIYRNAVPFDAVDIAGAFDSLFRSNGWIPAWRGTIHHEPHYHPYAHEAMGVTHGSATLRIGGPRGRKVLVDAGDALLLPAGTGHCRLDNVGRLDLVIAYPPDQSDDARKCIPTAAELHAIESLPYPLNDPIFGGARKL
jgi:uncharacterized protein YjlB